MSKLSLKEISQLDVKDLGKLFKGVKEKEIDYKIEEPEKKLKNKKGKPVLAIDIGSNSIKLVEGKFEKGFINIEKLIKIETPEGAILDGRILNLDIIVDALRNAISSNGIKAKNVIFTTNSSSIINREIIIPMVSREEIETVIKFEIQQYLPINLDDYIIQYLIIEEILIEDKKKLKVNVTSFPEIIANSYYKVINKLDLNPLALDVNYNSIRKLANNSGYKSVNENGSVAFVDIGATSINISIFKDGKLNFTRMIKVGGDRIDNYIKENLDISIKSTESIKIKEADLLEDSIILNKLVRESVDELLEEVERIIRFYNNKFSGEIEKVYIYGGTSKIKNLNSYVNSKIEIESEVLNSINNIKFIGKLDENNINDYLNAIGSIIRF